MHTRSTALLLNLGHAVDHLFLLIFATAVVAIARDWGMAWQDLMPYTAAAFALFGLGSLPAGRLGDLWGRRAMMIVFFVGMGFAALLIATATGVWHLAAALTVMGAFASIYHPVGIPMALMVRVILVMTLAGATSSMIFNFTTNGNGAFLAERLQGIVEDPATLGVLLAVVYTIASFAQIVVGKLIDKLPLKWIYLPIVVAQVPLFVLAAQTDGWPLYALMAVFMIFVFGAIPFVDAMIVQYVDDRMRS